MTVGSAPADAWEGISSDSSFSLPQRLRFSADYPAGTNSANVLLSNNILPHTDDGISLATGADASGFTRTSNEGTYTTTDPANIVDRSTYRTYEFLWQAGSVGFFYGQNTTATLTHTDNIPNEALKIWINNYQSATTMLVDWIALGKYVSPEPSITTWGSQVTR